MTGLVTHLLAWVGQHAHWAYLVVLLTALVEALLLIGLFVPAMPIMFGVGALVSAGSLGLWPALAAAAAGSALGDTFSFWLGRRYQAHLREVWPMSRYPRLFDQAEAFFRRHGSKSVLMGRFIGPMRPILPAVAGMASMSPLRFVVAAVVAGALWSPAYILPGVVFASSLGLAAEVGGRVVALILMVAAIVVAILWLIRRLIAFVEPHADSWISALLHWSSRHRRLGVIGTSLADPAQPELRGLALLTLILVGLAVLAMALIWSVSGAGPHAVDQGVLRLFEGLHSPWATGLFLHLSLAADWQVYVPVLAVGMACLLLSGHRAAAWHWLAALAPTLAFSLGTALWLHGAPGQGGSTRALQAIANSGAVWAFFAVILAHRGQRWWRRVSYTFVASAVALMAVGRLYLGSQWPTQVLIGLSLALVWTGLLAVAYRRHAPAPVPRALLLAVVAGTLALALATHWHQVYPARLAALRSAPPRQAMALRSWWRTDWAQLPAFRSDLKNLPAQPLDIQWAGRLPAIRSSLLRHGWQQPTPLAPRSVLRALSSNPPVGQLPVLPRLHDGRPPALMLTRPIDRAHQAVLYLWDSGVRLQPGGTPVWVGALAWQGRGRALLTVTYVRSGRKRSSRVPSLGPVLEAWSARRTGGHRTVLLVRPGPRAGPTGATGPARSRGDPISAPP